MAGFLNIYDKKTFTLRGGPYAVGSATNVTGVEFDGEYFWITNEDEILQCLLVNGSLYIQKTINIGAIISNLSTLDGIMTNGLDLFICYTYADLGPPIVIYTEIARLDKQGKSFKVIASSTKPSATGKYRDITYDNHDVLSVHLASGTPSLATIRAFDLIGDALKKQTTNTLRAMVNGFAYDNHNYMGPTIDTNQPFKVFDRTYKPLSPGVNTSISTTEGVCLIKDWMIEETMDINEAEAIGLVYN